MKALEAELVGLLEAGDLHGAMLLVNRAWLERYHPEAKYAAVVAHLGDGVPDIMEPVTSRLSCDSALRLAPA